MNQPKKCPFCSCGAKVIERNHAEIMYNQEDNIYAVRCMNPLCGGTTRWSNSKERAVDIWNNRSE